MNESIATSSRAFMQHKLTFLLFARLPLLVWLLAVASPSGIGADQPPGRIEIVIPLDDGQWYSVAAVRQEFSRKLGARSQSASTEEKRQLTPLDRAALLLAKQTGLLEVRFETDRLVIILPDEQSDQVRQENRDRLARLLNVDADNWAADQGSAIPLNAGFAI